jgi:hypothetical protein
MTTKHQQLYATAPVTIDEVRGASSQTIYALMTGISHGYTHNPWDVDDYERNRALLLCYPEWRNRISEMATVSWAWAALVEKWDVIEQLYDKDYAKHGNKAFGEGECDAYIRTLTRPYWGGGL